MKLALGNRPLRRKGWIAGLLPLAICVLASQPLLAAGSGGGLQVPNPPTGRFSQPGAEGLCQCIYNNKERQLSCLTSAAACESPCGHLYSFIPDASLSCPSTSNRPPVSAAVKVPR